MERGHSPEPQVPGVARRRDEAKLRAAVGGEEEKVLVGVRPILYRFLVRINCCRLKERERKGVILIVLDYMPLMQ